MIGQSISFIQNDEIQNISIILHHVTMFNFNSKMTDSKAASQNSATVQAQAGLEIEVVDFSRGGVGHRETGRLGGS